MASNPFLFFPMEPGSSSGTAAGSDPVPPFLQQNSVLYVPPLRIVAPPGISPFLPPLFDPHIVFNGPRPDLFPHAGSSSTSTSHGDHLNVRNRTEFDHVRGSANPADFARNTSGVGDYEPSSLGNGKHASFGGLWSENHVGSSSGLGKTDSPSRNFDNDQARRGIDMNAPAPSSVKVRYFSSFDGPRDRGQHGSENGDPISQNGTCFPHTSANESSKAKASAVRDFPFGCLKNGSIMDSKAAADADKIFSLHRDDGLPFDTRKRSREVKPKRHVAKKRPVTDGLSGSHSSSYRAVIDTLRLYDALRRSLILEEECKSKDANKGGRPDLNAGTAINANSLAVNRSQKVVGPVPGIDIGTLFYFRMEICCVGLHGPIQAGIEYVTAKESEYQTPVAISIISSGGYDAKDDGEELVYTGQGGKSALDSKPMEDQKLERGNLAMKGSMKHRVPVRVTRGVKDPGSPSGKTYTYDGLYMVEESWTEKGKFGFEEFKFRLRRCPGQAELGSSLLKLSNSLKYRPSEREGLCIADIAKGKEGVPVCVVNTVDNDPSPPSFEYSTSLQYPQEAAFYQQFGSTGGCDCEGACSPSESCSCFGANRNVFAYLAHGILVKERGVIFECGSNCKCPFSCKNRLTQRALKHRLEIFKTEDRGWGLRSWDTIPAGSFICEYTGKLVQNSQTLQTREYMLDLRRLPKLDPSWGNVSRFLDTHTAQVTSDVPRPDLVIDSRLSGNASRFINHSCSPNVLVQRVLRDYQDTKRPHVMLFAMDNLPPFRELTIDYGSKPPSLDYQVPGKQCLCKSAECKGIFYQ